MTPEQFAAEMKAIFDNYGGDLEGAHSRADDLMCDQLRRLGYAAGVEVFQDAEKWYA